MSEKKEVVEPCECSKWGDSLSKKDYAYLHKQAHAETDNWGGNHKLGKAIIVALNEITRRRSAH